MNRLFLFFFSLAIVAFGAPSFVPWLGVLAAGFGYALFWRSIAIFPLARQRFWRAALWYGLIALIQLSWMTSIEYQGFYILIVLVMLAIWLALQFACLTLLIPYNRTLSVGRLLAIAALWTLMEWGRFHYLFCGYSWNLAGMALSQSYSIQMAALFGVLGLSFWVMMVNLVALRTFFTKRVSNFLSWGVLAVFPYCFGLGYCLYHNAQKAGSKQLSCALVQTGLLPDEKILLKGKVQAFISPYDQWRRILSLLKEPPKAPLDLIVLPEAVVPFPSDQKIYAYSKMKKIFTDILGEEVEKTFPSSSTSLVSNSFLAQALANYFNAQVIIGLDHQEKNGTAYNSAFCFRPGNEEASRYDKQILMPLAEYLPFEWLRPLVDYYGINEFFTPGQEAKVFKGELPVGISICYEETFPEKIREGRKLGAKLLVNVSNDAWYPFSRLPSQHYEHARLRAVENGVSLIRACNTGITAAVNSLGGEIARLQETGPVGKPYSGALYTSVETYEHSTPYLFWGDAAILSISLLFLLGFLLTKTFLFRYLSE